VTPPLVLAPGDVCSVRTNGWEAALIRFGAACRGEPNLDNHIVVVHHTDATGTVWGIEGRPGGVGWVQVEGYFDNAYVVTNRLQPKTESQRATVCNIVEAMLHTPYDWPAIAEDALDDLHLDLLWGEKWKEKTPGHVVCSSLAAWAYYKANLKEPGNYLTLKQEQKELPTMQPSDWTMFDLENGYN
jgi:hypothetical protein